MTLQHEPSDGLSQLTEMMRDERVVENQPLFSRGAGKPPLDPEVRNLRRRRRLVGAGIALVTVLALAGTYAGLTLNAPVGAADATTHLPQVEVPSAAAIELAPDGASALSVAGADDYLGPDSTGIWMSSGGTSPARSPASPKSSPHWWCSARSR